MFADVAEMVLIFYNCQLLIAYCCAWQSFLLEFEEIILVQNTPYQFFDFTALGQNDSQ
jgi:hypothetical protein